MCLLQTTTADGVNKTASQLWQKGQSIAARESPHVQEDQGLSTAWQANLACSTCTTILLYALPPIHSLCHWTLAVEE